MIQLLARWPWPAGNPSYWTPERLASLKERDETAWRINALGEFIDSETGLLDMGAIVRNTRATPLEMPPTPGKYFAGMDPSDGIGKNAWTLVILRRIDPPGKPQSYAVACARQWSFGGPDEILRQVALACQRYKVTTVLSDAYSGQANTDLAKRYGLEVIAKAASQAVNLERYTNMATLLHTDLLQLPPDTQFRDDLLSIKKRATASGYVIRFGSSGHRHADYAPALACALANSIGSNATYIDRDALEKRGAQIDAILTSYNPGGDGVDWRSFPDEAWNNV